MDMSMACNISMDPAGHILCLLALGQELLGTIMAIYNRGLVLP